MNLQPEFQPLVNAALAATQDAFGARLAAFYLHGSIAMGDAVPQVSDLDAMLVLTDSVTQRDLAWQTAAQAQLAAQYPLIEDVHLNLISQSGLAQNAFACFALKYNATLLFGQNVTAALPCPAPDAAMAKSRLAFARNCFDDALSGKQPACTGPLPEDPFFRARKFARYFVVIEGAYFLMSQGKFTTFAASGVLPRSLPPRRSFPKRSTSRSASCAMRRRQESLRRIIFMQFLCLLNGCLTKSTNLDSLYPPCYHEADRNKWWSLPPCLVYGLSRLYNDARFRPPAHL